MLHTRYVLQKLNNNNNKTLEEDGAWFEYFTPRTAHP